MADETDKKDDLSPHALGLMACGAIWGLGMLVMYQDHKNPSSQAWDIAVGPTLLMLAMLVALPVGLYCLAVVLKKKPDKAT